MIAKIPPFHKLHVKKACGCLRRLQPQTFSYLFLKIGEDQFRNDLHSHGKTVDL